MLSISEGFISGKTLKCTLSVMVLAIISCRCRWGDDEADRCYAEGEKKEMKNIYQ